MDIIPFPHYHYQPLESLVQHMQPQEQEGSPHSLEIVLLQDHNGRSQNHEPETK